VPYDVPVQVIENVEVPYEVFKVVDVPFPVENIIEKIVEKVVKVPLPVIKHKIVKREEHHDEEIVRRETRYEDEYEFEDLGVQGTPLTQNDPRLQHAASFPHWHPGQPLPMPPIHVPVPQGWSHTPNPPAPPFGYDQPPFGQGHHGLAPGYHGMHQGMAPGHQGPGMASHGPGIFGMPY